jgi:hypothetical protein
LFFGLYLRVHLLYRPFARCESENPDVDSLDRLNELASMLYETIKDYAFAKLRNVFLNHVLANQSIPSLNDAESSIRDLPKLTQVPSDQSIDAYGNQKLAALLKRVKDSKVGELRNKVVHQHAYRPTLAEVESALEETRNIAAGSGQRSVQLVRGSVEGQRTGAPEDGSPGGGSRNGRPLNASGSQASYPNAQRQSQLHRMREQWWGSAHAGPGRPQALPFPAAVTRRQSA